MTEHFDEIGFETFTEVCSFRNIRCEANFQRNVGGNKWLQKRTFPGRVVKERKQRKEGWGGSRGVSVCVLMTLQKPEEAAGEESHPAVRQMIYSYVVEGEERRSGGEKEEETSEETLGGEESGLEP